MHLFDVFVNKTETAYSDELYVCQFQQVQHQISTCLHDFQSWSLFPCHHLNLQRGCGISVVVRVAVTYICIITIEFQCERSASLVTKEVTYSIEFIALARAFFLLSFKDFIYQARVFVDYANNLEYSDISIGNEHKSFRKHGDLPSACSFQ